MIYLEYRYLASLEGPPLTGLARHEDSGALPALNGGLNGPIG
jgi:hypothetical protein